jgi:hypothetical protein
MHDEYTHAESSSILGKAQESVSHINLQSLSFWFKK